MPTIAAIATPPGQGGIGIIRLSGPGSKSLLSRVFLPHSRNFTNFHPWKMHRGALLDAEARPIDDVLAVYMPAPRTYTGEEMVEVHCHGGMALVNAVLETFIGLGARLALPGEFTKRAYLNGRMDLTQAEAVAELIAAPAREAIYNSFTRLEGRLGAIVSSLINEVDQLRSLAKVSVDFPEDEIDALPREEFAAQVSSIINSIQKLLNAAVRANLVSRGARIVLAGPVNAGKSSLFNALGGYERSLVTDMPGTTRDYLEMSLMFDTLPVTLIDTAGVNQRTMESVEKLGIERTLNQIEKADLVCLVLDGNTFQNGRGPEEFYEILAHLKGKPVLLVWNKNDISPIPSLLPDIINDLPFLETSALTGLNIDGLASRISAMILNDAGQQSDDGVPPNLRQADTLQKAQEELKLLLNDINSLIPYDCCLLRLDFCSTLLGQVISLAPEDSLLDKIFSRFCIGK